jgi:hypothetical protein
MWIPDPKSHHIGYVEDATHRIRACSSLQTASFRLLQPVQAKPSSSSHSCSRSRCNAASCSGDEAAPESG